MEWIYLSDVAAIMQKEIIFQTGNRLPITIQMGSNLKWKNSLQDGGLFLGATPKRKN